MASITRVSELTDAKRRLIERLKRVDSATASELAAEFDLTDTAVRQHLESLFEAGLVRRIVGSAQGRGRPASRWQLTDMADGAFPDRHGDLTVDLIESIRSTLGDEALDRVIGHRAKRQLAQYRRAVDGLPIEVRVRRLAEQRTAEGYVAEVIDEGDHLVLIEHHCPVRAAARSCGALCRSELEVFDAALGDDVEVTRLQHVLSGDQRCAYLVRRRPAA